jgi:hypothetical protein
VDFVALKLCIGVSEAIGWVARELDIPTDGEPRQIHPGTPDADGYTCQAFRREGWPDVLPERVAAGYEIIADEERRRNLPPFGMCTSASARDAVVQRVKDGRLPDARPWLPLSYREFAERLTGDSRHLRTAQRVYGALEAASLIELQRGTRRAVGEPQRATCVLRVWPVPPVPSQAQLREFLTPWRGGVMGPLGAGSAAPTLASSVPLDIGGRGCPTAVNALRRGREGDPQRRARTGESKI